MSMIFQKIIQNINLFPFNINRQSSSDYYIRNSTRYIYKSSLSSTSEKYGYTTFNIKRFQNSLYYNSYSTFSHFNPHLVLSERFLTLIEFYSILFYYFFLYVIIFRTSLEHYSKWGRKNISLFLKILHSFKIPLRSLP